MQVSANFPGGFPIRPLRTERFAFFLTDRFEEVSEHGIRMGRDILMPDEDIAWMNRHQQFLESDRPLPRRLMLTDGGVFDNLAVDWFLRSEERLDQFRMSLNWEYATTTGERQSAEDPREEALLEPIRDDSDCLIIVNAGVTSHWRHGLESSVLLPLVGEAMGFSQVASTMYNNYTKKRIAELEEHVVVEMGFAERLVRTTLLPLGRAATASLLEAGYWQTRTAIELKFGRASTSGPDEEPIQAMLDRSARLTARCERLSRGLIEDAGGTTDEERG
jgi:hypothetical protein